MASGYSELESAIETLVHKYYDYAKKKGKHDKMNKEEFKEIVQQELSNIMTFTSNKELINKHFQSLDVDKDGKIGFDEYWTLIGEIALKLRQRMAMEYQMPSSQTELEGAILTTVKWFIDHAGEEGIKETLSVNDFIKLSQTELPHLMKDVSLEEMVKLSINQDSDMKFGKYWSLVGLMSKNVERDMKPKKQ
ncbi:protein S100-A16-like [Phyllobates terribilis]|uniref:protein S100-A16-like n=1 Tax=Phyllobates terribilis TaxID=111132 RepID=UPI003CCA7457